MITSRTKCTLKGFKVHMPYRNSSYKGIRPLLLRVIWPLRYWVLGPLGCEACSESAVCSHQSGMSVLNSRMLGQAYF